MLQKYIGDQWQDKRKVLEEDYFGERTWVPSSSTSTIRKRYVNTFDDDGALVLSLIEYFRADSSTHVIVLQIVEDDTIFTTSGDATKI